MAVKQYQYGVNNGSGKVICTPCMTYESFIKKKQKETVLLAIYIKREIEQFRFPALTHELMDLLYKNTSKSFLSENY